MPAVRTLGEWRRAARALLRDGNIEAAGVETDWIAEHVLGLRAVDLTLERDRPLTPNERRRLSRLLHKRLTRIPLQYLLGEVDFWGRSLRVTPAVLIPRPETEGLVERVLSFLKDRPGGTVVDIGTGSGAIAVTLAGERRDLRVWGTDISEAAIRVARTNAKRIGVGDRVRFFVGDLTGPVRKRSSQRSLQALVSNPPYVSWRDRSRLDPEVLDHEPHAALFAQKLGMAVILRLIVEGAELLPTGALWAVEIAEDQGARVRDALLADGRWRRVRVEKDLAGKDRYALAERRG